MISTGKLDIAMLPDNRIVFKYNKKFIGIEIKNGKTFDTKNIFQIERYMIDSDLLLMMIVLELSFLVVLVLHNDIFDHCEVGLVYVLL